MVDAGTRRAFVDKTPVTIKDLIVNMAQNAQQFGTRSAVNELIHLQLIS